MNVYGDVLAAELELYGSRGRHLSVRRAPGGADKPRDLAARWIKGEHEEVLAAIAARPLDIVLESATTKKPRRAKWVDVAEIARLRSTGMTMTAIAKQLGISMWTVHRRLKKLNGARPYRCQATT